MLTRSSSHLCRIFNRHAEAGGGWTQAAVKVANAKKSSILNRMKLAGFQSSTKIEALREELALMLARDPSAKALVFSQFTSMLDLIYYRLQQVRPLVSCNSPVIAE